MLNVIREQTNPVSQQIKPLPYDVVALVLQGGGALGAYQAGVYEGLHEAGIRPNWLAGISIGALNAAIIAGSPEGERVTTAARVLGDHLCLFDRVARRRRAGQCLAVCVRHQLGAQCDGGDAGPGPGPARLLQAALPLAALVAVLGRCRDQLLRHGTVTPDAGAARRLRPAELGRSARQRRRGQRPHRQFDLFRHRRTPARTEAFHGLRRPAAGIPRRRDRRRALLGWRRRLQHASLPRAVRRALRHADIPDRSLVGQGPRSL